MLLEKLKEEYEIDFDSSESLFIDFYNNLMKYEKVNRIPLISERIREYIDNLIREIGYLEKITSFEICSGSSESYVQVLNEDFDIVKEKINFIINEEFEDKTEELLDNIILNSKLELLPKIEEYKENLEIGYAYYMGIKSNFNQDIGRLNNEFLSLIEQNNKKTLKQRKVKINEEAKGILKDRKLNEEDISIEDIKVIKNIILNIDEINREYFNIYLGVKINALNLFNEVQENTVINQDENQDELSCEVPVDISILNKRYFKFIESNHSLIKNKFINDIQSKLGAESIENKLEIELIYAHDFIKDEYIKKLKEFTEELKAKNNLNVYSNFKSLYGDMLTVQEQISILDRIYLKVKELDFINFSDVNLIDYLNHSK